MTPDGTLLFGLTSVPFFTLLHLRFSHCQAFLGFRFRNRSLTRGEQTSILSFYFTTHRKREGLVCRALISAAVKLVNVKTCPEIFPFYGFWRNEVKSFMEIES